MFNYNRIAILNNIASDKFTTVLGCIVAGLSALGEHLENYPEYSTQGKILTSVASFIGAVGLLLARNPKLVHKDDNDSPKNS